MMTNCVYKNINGFKIDKTQFVINKNVNLHKIKGTMGQSGPMDLKFYKDLFMNSINKKESILKDSKGGQCV